MHAFFEQHQKPFRAFLSTALTFPLHLHPQLELYQIVHGEAIVTIHSESRTLQAGDMAVIFPNQIHSYTSLSPDTQARLMICDLSYTGRYTDTLLLNAPENPFIDMSQLHPNVSYAVQELVKEAQLQEDSSVFAPFVQLILARTIPLLKLQRNGSADHQELTYQITNYISEHFQEPLTLTQLAQSLGISKYHLSHVFSEKIGQNFPSYLSRIRLSYACGMLADTDLSVTEIAEEAGFESQRTFFRVFQEQYGMTPLRYRHSTRNTR